MKKSQSEYDGNCEYSDDEMSIEAGKKNVSVRNQKVFSLLGSRLNILLCLHFKNLNTPTVCCSCGKMFCEPNL